jgi:hypothetical protein
MRAVPALAPVTTPPTTVATPVAELLHAPPATVEVSVVAAPVHTVGVPDNVPATGIGLTVIIAKLAAEPQVFVTV